MNTSILLDTLGGIRRERPPVWFMRQAGRVLPSYRAIKEKYSFWEMMQHPEIGAEVTLLPVNDLGVDAAILFSDILVIPYAMGMGLDFSDKGPVFDKPLLAYDNPLKALHPATEKLEYIYHVIDQIKLKQPAHIPLIGFCGAPLTVLCYMLEGLGSKKEFPKAIEFFYKEKETTKKLIEAITELSILYAKEQIKHGVQVFQLFDTHAGLISISLYNELFMPAIHKIADAIRQENIPFIFFPKGIGMGIQYVTPATCDFISIDWQTPLSLARQVVHPEVGLQGNLDPRLLYASPERIIEELNTYIPFGEKHHDWIFNLGHGFLPDIPFENAKLVVDWIKSTQWNR